ncbi:MAG: hypothetical protein Q3962_04475 [Corynebacterium sp.]|nr:hypothetical protein [Corynebacterium sp.]
MRAKKTTTRLAGGLALLAFSASLAACSTSSASTDTPPGPTFPSESPSSESSVVRTSEAAPALNNAPGPQVNAIVPTTVPNETEDPDDEVIIINPLMPELVTPGEQPTDPDASVAVVTPSPTRTQWGWF